MAVSVFLPLPVKASLGHGPQAMRAGPFLPEGQEKLVVPHNEGLRSISPLELTAIISRTPYVGCEFHARALAELNCLPRNDLCAGYVVRAAH